MTYCREAGLSGVGLRTTIAVSLTSDRRAFVGATMYLSDLSFFKKEKNVAELLQFSVVSGIAVGFKLGPTHPFERRDIRSTRLP